MSPVPRTSRCGAGFRLTGTKHSISCYFSLSLAGPLTFLGFPQQLPWENLGQGLVWVMWPLLLDSEPMWVNRLSSRHGRCVPRRRECQKQSLFTAPPQWCAFSWLLKKTVPIVQYTQNIIMQSASHLGLVFFPCSWRFGQKHLEYVDITFCSSFDCNKLCALEIPYNQNHNFLFTVFLTCTM